MESTYHGIIAKNPKRDFSLFLKDGHCLFFYCFGRKNLVYVSIARIIRGSGFYDIAMKIPTTLVINLLIFIWLLQGAILHMKISGVTLLQITR